MNQWFAKFSKDSEYLFLGKQGEAQVFRLCGGHKDYGYNYEDKLCEKCSEGVENTRCIIVVPETSQLGSGLPVIAIVFIVLFVTVTLLSCLLLLYIYRLGR